MKPYTTFAFIMLLSVMCSIFSIVYYFKGGSNQATAATYSCAAFILLALGLIQLGIANSR